MKELYDLLIEKPISMVDSGEVFKKGFFLVFKLLAIATGIFGIYTIIVNLTGGNGYFASFGRMDGFLVFRSVVTFIITLLISLATFFVIGLIFWKSGDDFKNKEYNGLALIASRLLKIYGQVLAVLFVSLGLVCFFTAIIAGKPYFPVIDLLAPVLVFAGPARGFFGLLYSGFSVTTFGDYMNTLLNLGLLGLIAGVVCAFIALVVTYFLAEIYEIVLYFLLRKQIFKGK
jgi:hypothetical protein